ncbi:MAG TPA: hypothetical protein VLI54_03705 [Bacillota bacterium]|nr:hypothetical protein [Bacillota bacterium]
MSVIDIPRHDLIASPQGPPPLGWLEVQSSSDPNSLLWDTITRVESGVFMDCGYVATHEELQREYEDYLDSSTMIGLLNDGDVAGGGRYIAYGPAGFKTINDIIKGRIEADKNGLDMLANVDYPHAAEIGTTILEKQYRSRAGGALVGLVYGAFYQRAVNTDVTALLATLDYGYAKGFLRRFKEFATQLGPPVEYMGSLSVPVHMDVTKMDMEMFVPSKSQEELREERKRARLLRVAERHVAEIYERREDAETQRLEDLEQGIL